MKLRQLATSCFHVPAFAAATATAVFAQPLYLQVANPELAQVVKMDEPFRIYRDIFAKWGWDAR